MMLLSSGLVLGTNPRENMGEQMNKGTRDAWAEAWAAIVIGGAVSLGVLGAAALLMGLVWAIQALRVVVGL